MSTEPAVFTLTFLEATYRAGYERGVTDGRALADAQAAHNFAAAAGVVRNMIGAPSLTPDFLTEPSERLAQLSQERIDNKRNEVRAANYARHHREGAA